MSFICTFYTKPCSCLAVVTVTSQLEGYWFESCYVCALVGLFLLNSKNTHLRVIDHLLLDRKSVCEGLWLCFYDPGLAASLQYNPPVAENSWDRLQMLDGCQLDYVILLLPKRHVKVLKHLNATVK